MKYRNLLHHYYKNSQYPPLLQLAIGRWRGVRGEDMEREKFTIEQIKQQRLLPLYYHDNPTVCIRIANALFEAGVKCFEFTNRGDKALENFKELVKEKNSSMKESL